MRLLVVEDDPKIASFLTKEFQEAGFAVDHFANGEEGLMHACKTPYDVAIVDLMLPGLDGLSLIEQMRTQKVQTPAIVLSAKRSVEDRVLCLQRGADDYVGKPFAFSELLARVHAVTRRAQGASEPIRIEAGGIVLDLLSRVVTREGHAIELQPREFSLLELLMRSPGKALSKTFLMERLWDLSIDPHTNIVDVLVCRLRGKIDKDFEQKRIRTMRGVGYVFRAD